MKGTDYFKETIKNYLDEKAKNDELFRAKYEVNPRPIDDVVTYILNQVQKSGCHGFCDDEIYGMAVHFYEENITDIGKPMNNCNVYVNHQVELSEEEKEEQRKIALKRFQDEELRKLEQRNKPKAKPQTETKQPQLSLFDEI